MPKPRWTPALILACIAISGITSGASETELLDNFDTVGGWRPLSGQPTPSVSKVDSEREGQKGTAIRFTFFDSTKAQFVGRSIQANPAWDQAQGISFWFKGDGSDGFIAVTLTDDTFTYRQAALVSLQPKEWRRITLSWNDFIPETIGTGWLKGAGSNMPPSSVRALWFGRWFYFKPWSGCTFEADDLRLEEKIDRQEAQLPAEAGIPRTLAKLRAKAPVTIITLGDSVTYGTQLKERDKFAYPAVLQGLLRKTFGYDGITVLNKSSGGLETRHGMALIPRDVTPFHPDLVTVHFGYNDFSAMQGKRLTPEENRAIAAENARQFINRLRVATQNRAEVLWVATVPGAESRQTAMDFFGTEARAVSEALKCGFSDAPHAALQSILQAGKAEEIFLRTPNGGLDPAHLNELGQKIFAEELLKSFR